MSQHDDLFDLVDACDLRVPDKRTIDERPDLLELYTRHPRRIEPHAPKIDRWFWAFIITFGVLIFLALVMCL
ncbi:hypothetical protein [Corynebacterium amycolatum]|uniref:hypothetical protein n=1 Tax=Corynebacterium amycolatum TaxID=43765 RepID=UPI00234DDD09|nr:hypothetical protein [Corynebacterium amycolatum]MDC7116126.1 hypothetical protein [Corynebacterium amycolatum]